MLSVCKHLFQPVAVRQEIYVVAQTFVGKFYTNTTAVLECLANPVAEGRPCCTQGVSVATSLNIGAIYLDCDSAVPKRSLSAIA
jgi:hypothetical protein